MDEEDDRAANAERSRIGRIAAVRQVAWFSLLSQPDGRRFCYELLERGHIFVTSFRDNPILMAFAEGERNYALQLNSDMAQANPEGYALMLKESNSRKEKVNE